MDNTSNCNNFYIIGSIILISVILHRKLTQYSIEGLCLCSGAQMPFDKQEQPRHQNKTCQKDFSMVV